MKKLIILLFVLLPAFCFAETELGTMSFSTGESFGNYLKFCPDGEFLRTTDIHAIIPYQDGFLIKLCTPNNSQPYEVFAKKGTKFYLLDGSTTIIGEVSKISSNTMELRCYLE